MAILTGQIDNTMAIITEQIDKHWQTKHHTTQKTNDFAIRISLTHVLQNGPQFLLC
jgi:hypothetical protein